jgi:hypothetical protein
MISLPRSMRYSAKARFEKIDGKSVIVLRV